MTKPDKLKTVETSTSKLPKMKLLALTIGGLALLLSTGIALAELNKGDADMVLQTTQAKKPATFPHEKHQAVLTCADCHHGKNTDGTQKAYVEGQEILKCVSCHNKQEMTNKKLNSFKNAGHANCKNCHKKMAKAGKPTGPVKCSGCHPKK